MEIFEGLMLNLKCRVQGDRNPQIRWFKDDRPLQVESNGKISITVSVRQSHLRVKNVKPSDSGNYSCIGKSNLEQMTRWIYVTVIPHTKDRSVSDEKAYHACPVNTCTFGKCLLIDEKPVCRCPQGYTGANCSISNNNVQSHNTIDTSLSSDLFLDQPPTDSPAQLTTNTMISRVNWTNKDKCHLPKFHNLPECQRVNSYLHWFVGTAIACSLVILTAVCLFGYLRRRRLLQQQQQQKKSMESGVSKPDVQRPDSARRSRSSLIHRNGVIPGLHSLSRIDSNSATPSAVLLTSRLNQMNCIQSNSNCNRDIPCSTEVQELRECNKASKQTEIIATLALPGDTTGNAIYVQIPYVPTPLVFNPNVTSTLNKFVPSLENVCQINGSLPRANHLEVIGGGLPDGHTIKCFQIDKHLTNKSVTFK